MTKSLFCILAITSILSTSPLQAKKKVIVLTEQMTSDNKSKWQKEDRSIKYSIRFILHDDNTFYIYSDIPLEEAKLTVKDKHNNIVYSTIESILPDEENIFILNIGNGNYMIELEYKESICHGYFEISK